MMSQEEYHAFKRKQIGIMVANALMDLAIIELAEQGETVSTTNIEEKVQSYLKRPINDVFPGIFEDEKG